MIFDIDKLKNYNFKSYNCVIFDTSDKIISVIENYLFNDFYLCKYGCYILLIYDDILNYKDIDNIVEIYEISLMIKVKYYLIENILDINNIKQVVDSTIDDINLLDKYQNSNFNELIYLKLIDSISISKKQELLSNIINKYPNLDNFSYDKNVYLEFINNNFNIALTSRILFLHRNSLIYKLDKLYEITNLDIRTFQDALIYKMYCILSL